MDGVVNQLIAYSYLFLFFGVVVEGEIFPLAAGMLVAMSFMNLYAAIAVTFVGAVVGDILWFKVASHWGRMLLNRFGKFLWLKRDKLAGLEEHFKQNGKKTLFVTKFIYTFGHSSIIVAGLARMNFKEFIKVDLIASFLWACLFVLLGNFFGASFSALKHMLRDVVWAGIIVLVVLIIVQVYARKKLSRQV